jgi:hypothetical protein
MIIDFFYGKSEDKSIEEFHLHFIYDFMELFHGKILILEKENMHYKCNTTLLRIE